MPTATHVPAHDRIYGRVDKFVLECPRCLCLIMSDKEPYAQRVKYQHLPGWRKEQPYNAVAGRVKCPGCGTIYGVGLVLWRVADGQRGVVPPADQIASALEQAREQAYTKGIDHPKAAAYRLALLARGEPLDAGNDQNLSIAPGCDCAAGLEGRTAGCPVHGIGSE